MFETVRNDSRQIIYMSSTPRLEISWAKRYAIGIPQVWALQAANCTVAAWLHTYATLLHNVASAM